MMTERETPFAVIGEEVPPDASAEEALELGGLSGWGVRKVPLIAHDQRHSYIPIPGRFATVRNMRDGEIPGFLGVVGERYKVLQNEDLIPFLEEFREQVGAVFNSAGVLASDAEVFVSLKSLDAHPVGDDRIDVYYMVTQDHQGKIAPAVSVLPVSRMAGAVLNVRMGIISPKYRIRDRAGDAVRAADRYTTRIVETASRLADTSVTHSDLENALLGVFSPPGGCGPASTRRRNHVHHVLEMYRDLSALGPSVWRGFVSLMKWYDQAHPVRGPVDPERVRSLRAVKHVDQKTELSRRFLRELGESL